MNVRTISKVTLCTSLSVLGTAVSANPQTGMIQGTVRDAAGKPLANAQVLLLRTRDCAQTDSAGAYSFFGEDVGSDKVQVSAATYQVAVSSVTVKPDAVIIADFFLQSRGTIVKTISPHPQMFGLRPILRNLQPARQDRTLR